jgi:arylsulfatase A-like enzyme
VPLVGEAHAKTFVPEERRGRFEFWEGFESGFLLNDPWLHGTALPSPQRFPGYQSDVLADRFIAWSGARKKNRPFFAVVSLEAPHPPYDAPSAGVPVRAPAEIQLRSNVLRGAEVEAKARKELAGYYAHLTATDRALGRLLEHVDAETIVVFTSVHGDMHGAHGLFRKGWPHEESVRVPLLIRHPAEAPHVDPSPVSLVDLPRMARAWSGGQTPEIFAPGGGAKISMPSVVALPYQADRAWRGVRTKTRKLALNADGSPWLFFDLERDPFELCNLADDPARQAEIRELAQQV